MSPPLPIHITCTIRQQPYHKLLSQPRDVRSTRQLRNATGKHQVEQRDEVAAMLPEDIERLTAQVLSQAGHEVRNREARGRQHPVATARTAK